MDPKQSAPAPEDRTPGAAAQAPPDQAPSSAPAQDTRPERDRLAERGRELKALQDQNAALAAQVQSLSAGQAQVLQHLTSQQNAAEEARINSLPPVERAEARAAKVERDNIQLRNWIAQRDEQRTRSEYAERRSRELLEAANAHFGLKGEQALSINDLPANAMSSEQAFTEALNTAGFARVRSAAPAQPAAPASGDSDDLKEQVKKEVLLEMGVTRPLTARASMASSPATDADLQRLAWEAGVHTKGPAQMRKALQETRDDLRAKARAAEKQR